MLHEDTHTNTQARHTVIDTNRYHCSLHTTSLRYRQLRTIGGNRDRGYLAPHLWRGASDVWLQQSGESGGRTDLEPADDVGIESQQVFIRFSKFSHYVGLLPFNENKKKNQRESILLPFLTDIRKRSALKVPKVSRSFQAIKNSTLCDFRLPPRSK